MQKRSYIYPEISIYYVFEKAKRIWKNLVKMFKIIGRICNRIPLIESEKYNLRLLLIHVEISTNFENIRTYQNIIYVTFKKAAMQRRLLKDGTKLYRCLSETSNFQMPKHFRQLFSFT